MTIRKALALSFAGIVSLGFAASALASQVAYNTGSTLALGSEGKGCPNVVTVDQTTVTYEGGATTTGSVDFSDMATDIDFLSSDESSVSWIVTLKPEFAKCAIGARASSILSLDVEVGTLILTLNLNAQKAGHPVSNPLPTSEAVILNQNIKGLKAVYSFAFAD